MSALGGSITPPTGTLTFLFTDIEGSTARWERQRAAMSAALIRHDEIVRAAIEGHDGHIFKTVGDAFYAVFSDAAAALAAALAAQRALEAERWTAFGHDFADLKVRVGLHTGRAEARAGDYFGPDLNRTARLVAAGHGGQVLLSMATRQLVSTGLPDGVRLRDLGRHRLKDLRRPEHIWQALATGVADVTTPLVTADRARPRNRIIVDDSGTERSPGDTLSALRAAVRDDDVEVTITLPEVRQLLEARPHSIEAYRLARIAEWSQPRYQLDSRFVAMSLLLDRGEDVVTGRWVSGSERYEDLGAVLATAPEPAIVVLGPPGSGKSTLLRHLELETAIAAVRGEDAAEHVTYVLPLNQYKASAPGQPIPAPDVWLASRWAATYPSLPPLDDLLAEGRMTLLLDGLNEMPASGERGFREQVGWWKDWLVRLTSTRPGNRVVFSCRTLDYSAPLSTPELRVPQAQIEPLSDAQISAFLRAHSPVHGDEIWSAIADTPQLDTLRAPYFLALLVDQVEATGELTEDRPGLFTGFVRQALKREVERDNALFAIGDGQDADPLLHQRDIRRIVQWRWRDAYQLPERGPLLPRLAGLAYRMQEANNEGEQRQVRVDYDTALDLVNHERDENILAAGVAISVLDEDPAADEVLYRHQLLQEYFAARVLARDPQPQLVSTAWRSADLQPSLREVLDAMSPADAVPPLPTTGWEETTVLAAAMSAAPEPFLKALMAENLVVAGRAAHLVRGTRHAERLSPTFVDALRQALAARSRDPNADLRARIDAGLALGWLGDPRFDRQSGPQGDYLSPPLVSIPAGTYPLGDDEPIDWLGGRATAHIPRHTVEVGPFRIGRFPVTVAEYTCFLEAGGYEDERWWDTAAARDWRVGIGTADGERLNVRFWRSRLLAEPELAEQFVSQGSWNDEIQALWEQRLAMTEIEFETHLREMYPEQRCTAPREWGAERYKNPALPVLGVCWFEARAYCRWLAAQTGNDYRLPTEAEWEAAARGMAGRVYAFGNTYDPLSANTLATRVRRPTPVGVFLDGDTPEGVSDLTGNAWEWTSSLLGHDAQTPAFRYPYRGDDGREDAEAGPDVLRIARGGSWCSTPGYSRSACRDDNRPGYRSPNNGFRVALSGHASSGL